MKRILRINVNYMTTRNIFCFGLIVFYVFISPGTSGQTLDTIKIDNKQSILNDRAFFIFPTHAANIKRGVDIMSADPNANVETRIMLDVGEMRLVFFAQELFSISGKDLLSVVSKQNEGRPFTTKKLTDRDGLLSVLSTPTKFDSTKEAILINSLIVKTQDNTLFRLTAYISPKAFRLKDQFQKLAEAVFNTVTTGTRTSNLAARQEKRLIFGTNKSFIFDLPAHYAITVDQQYDFQVFKLHRYQHMTDTTWVQLIIYAGHHPSAVYKDYNLPENDAQKVAGKFINKNVDWLLFSPAGQGFLDKEQMVKCDNIAEGLIVHIAMLSNQPGLIDALTKIVEDIQLVEK